MGGIMQARTCIVGHPRTHYDPATDRYVFPQFPDATKDYAKRLILDTTCLKLGPREELQMFELPAVPPEGKEGIFAENHRANWGIYVESSPRPGAPTRTCTSRMLDLASHELKLPPWFMDLCYSETAGNATHQFWAPITRMETI